MESLTIQITERGNRRVEIESLLKLMQGPEWHQLYAVSNVKSCDHISRVTSDRVWVSDLIVIALKSAGGGILHPRGSFVNWLEYYNDGCGSHTVNNKNEFFYIDEDLNIKKLSKDVKTITLFKETTSSSLKPRCLYWSPYSGDLLVAMVDIGAVYVIRYNQAEHPTQTIQHSNSEWYGDPYYITENNNQDVVVCYSRPGAVVVTERGGRHRFSYTGHPSGSVLWPRGICTDALSHILVCDDTTKTVQMLDRDGQFLSHLLIRPSGIFSPWSLSYDVNTHRLWVGSRYNNKVCVYRYIDRQGTLTRTSIN